MFPRNNPERFTDKLTVEFLERTYDDHHVSTETLALSEIHSLNLPLPRFNTLACLSKTEFNKLLSQLKHKYPTTQSFITMVAAITDTYTCMIQNYQLYESYTGDNKHGLDLLMNLLQAVKRLVIHIRGAIEMEQLPVLIKILERSAQRIRNEETYYKILQEIVCAMKDHMLNNANKLTKEDVVRKMQENYNFVSKSRKLDNYLNVNVESNKNPLIKSPQQQVFSTSKLTPGIKSNGCVIDKDECDAVKSLQKQSINSLASTMPLKPKNSNDKPKNAFELMMNSSKMLSLKKKL